MKSINNFIESLRNEVITEKKHSALTKYKNKSVEKDIDVIVGDIYDLSGNNSVKDKFKYYKAEGNGYIIDKNGYVYDLSANEYAEDQGRIAGGCMNYRCTIYNINNKNLSFYGYNGVFSHPSSPTCSTIVSDINAGMYLEDYIAKHWLDLDSSLRNDEIIVKLKELGDADAKTDKENTAAKRAKAKEDFRLRYLPFIYMDSNKSDADKGSSGFRVIVINNDVKIFKAGQSYSETNVINEILPINDNNRYILIKIKELISKTFKRNLSDLNGLVFNCILKLETNNEEYKRIMHLFPSTIQAGWDVKKNKMVCIDYNKVKIVKDVSYKLILGNTIYLFEKANTDFSKYALDIFTKMSKIWKRETVGGRSAYIQQEYKKIINARNLAAAKRIAGENYDSLMKLHYFNKNNIGTGWNYVCWPTEYLKKADENIDLDVVVDLPTETKTAPEVAPVITEITSETAPEKPKQVKGIEPTAHMIERIDKWMNDPKSKGINLKATGDAKLIGYYNLCKSMKFERGLNIIKQEIDKRNLSVDNIKESLKFNTLSSYIKESLI